MYIKEKRLNDILAKLTKKEKKVLKKLFCEVSESSYRRGVQQALTLDREFPDRLLPQLRKESHHTIGIHNWRYKNKNRCVGIDGYKSSIEDRLLSEHYWIYGLVESIKKPGT